MTTVVGGLAEAVVLVMVARGAFALGAGDSDVRFDLGPLGVHEVSIATLLLITAGVTLFRLATQLGNAWQVASITSETLAELRRATLHLFLEASWGLQSREREGHLQETSTTDATHASNVVLQLVVALVSVFNLLALLAVAFAVDFVATLAVIAAVVALALILLPIRRAVRRRSQESAHANLVYATAVAETASTAREIRIFNVQAQTRRRIDGYIDAHRRKQFKTRFLVLAAPGLYQTAAVLFVVGIMSILYLGGLTRVASLGAVILIMLRSFGYGETIQTSYQMLHENAPYLERLLAEQRRYRGAAVTRARDPVGKINEIGFDHVWFEYEPGRPVLRNVSFRVRRGEIVGIVGPSGGGKSTLVQLLLRLREPTQGTVIADERDVRQLSLDDWYERVSFVPQDARLFSGSVADNIRFSREDVDEVGVERAARLAHLHEDIVSWPGGYETPVGERGDELSGGQRQRLCIARSLAGEPDVLVLDEPTSALDARSEALVRETLTALAPRTTIFIIAHRLSTLDTCDRLMVLQGGELAAFDAPAALRLSSPLYRETLRLAGLR